MATRMITLESSDGKIFEVDEMVAKHSVTIREMIEGDCYKEGILLPIADGKILSKLIEYCKKHVEAAAEAAAASNSNDDTAIQLVDDGLKNWDAEFVKVDYETLFQIILAANYLEIPGILDLTGRTLADVMKGKTPDEIKKTFNIKDDFTFEEEEVLTENSVIFSDESIHEPTLV